MKNKLIQEIQEVQNQRKSGLLLTVVTISAQADANPAISVLVKQPEFSFFFKDGALASIMCRGIQGGAAIARAAYIEAVIRTNWTAIQTNAIPLMDPQLSTEMLLDVLGAAKRQPTPALSNGSAISADAVMDLQMHIEAVFTQVMGPRGAGVLKNIHGRFNPHLDRNGFIQACVAELTPLLGRQNAKSMLQL